MSVAATWEMKTPNPKRPKAKVLNLNIRNPGRPSPALVLLRIPSGLVPPTPATFRYDDPPNPPRRGFGIRSGNRAGLRGLAHRCLLRRPAHPNEKNGETGLVAPAVLAPDGAPLLVPQQTR